MRLARQVSGKRVVDHPCKRWDYRKVNQVGSHVILVTDEPSHHRLPVPLHEPLGIGIFKKILNEVCTAKNITQEELLKDF